jgi:hypothetical protein
MRLPTYSWSKLGIAAGVAAIALLSGCAAPGPAFTGWDKPPDGKALLYVYRKVNFQPDMAGRCRHMSKILGMCGTPDVVLEADK